MDSPVAVGNLVAADNPVVAGSLAVADNPVVEGSLAVEEHLVGCRHYYWQRWLIKHVDFGPDWLH